MKFVIQIDNPNNDQKFVKSSDMSGFYYSSKIEFAMLFGTIDAAIEAVHRRNAQVPNVHYDYSFIAVAIPEPAPSIRRVV